MRALVAILVVLALGTARAETERATAIQIDREATPLTRPELGFDGGAPLPGGWGLALGLGWIEEPIAFVAGDATSYPVRRRETTFLAGSLAIGEAVILDVGVPLSHQVGDRLRLADGSTSDERTLDRWVMGDLGLGARMRVVNRPAWGVFVRGDVTLPSGDSGDFAGEASWTLAWALVGRAQLPANLTVAATAGIRIRGEEVRVADRLVGSELTGAAGIGWGLPPIRPLWCEPDQVQLTAEAVGVLGDRVAGERGPSPSEVRFGLVTRPRANITFGLRAGVGLSDAQIGAPAFRALAVLTFAGAGTIASLFPEIERAPEADDDEEESH